MTHNIITPSLWEDVKNRARRQWTPILESVGIPQQCLRNKHGPCPICGGKDRFRFDDKNGDGTFFCNGVCGAGDGFNLIKLFRNCTSREALQLVSDVLGCKEIARIPQHSYPVISPESDRKLVQTKREQLYKIWKEAKEITPGDPAHKYLTITRKLLLCEIPAVLRIHSGLPYYEEKKCLGTYPTMLAKVENIHRELVCLHRTFLTDDGYKAPTSRPKKLMPAIYVGATRGASIKLFQATDILGIAEGIETALACHIATDLPIWAAISAGGMASLIVPDNIQELVIFADNDQSSAGNDAARALARRMLQKDRLVRILLPDELGKDWADIVTVEDKNHE